MWMEVIRVEQSWKIKVERKCWKHKFGKWPHKHPTPPFSLSLSLYVSLSPSVTVFQSFQLFFLSVLLWDVHEGHQKTLSLFSLSLSLSHHQSCLAAYSLHLVLIWASFPPSAIQPKTISSFNFQGKLLNGFSTKQAFLSLSLSLLPFLSLSLSPSLSLFLFISPLPFIRGSSYGGPQWALRCLASNNELPSNKAGAEKNKHVNKYMVKLN